MELQFQNFINQHALFNHSHKLLLGVSGGIDSVAMLMLLRHSGYNNLMVAHCNFNLRGEESDGDEHFIEHLCNQLNVPFVSIKFDTQQYAQSNNISVQMAARELRYRWFNEMQAKHQTDFVAIAHNSDDVIETFLLNLGRGTGLHGLTGIKAKNGNIVRPLLAFSREEIEKYITEKNIPFREDSSNRSTKYHRNKIRHKILPLFEELFPAYRKTMIENIKRLSEIEKVYRNEIAQKFEKCCTINAGGMQINIARLSELNPISTYLFEFLRDADFHADVVEDIAQSLHSEAGKLFHSPTHTLLKDRSFLIVQKKETMPSFFSFDIEEEEAEKREIVFSENETSYRVKIRKQNRTTDFELPLHPSVACIDADKIVFPIQIRHWQTGDYFYPLGMNKRKKVSDFFSDLKIPRLTKSKIWFFTSASHIVWIASLRIDNRYKITEKTKTLLILEIEQATNNVSV